MKVGKLLIIAAAAAILLFSGCLSEEQFKQCSANDDCIMVKEDCCGCQMGGKSTAINKIYEGQWNAKMAASCAIPQGCLAVYMCEGRQPLCVERQCQLMQIIQ